MRNDYFLVPISNIQHSRSPGQISPTKRNTTKYFSIRLSLSTFLVKTLRRNEIAMKRFSNLAFEVNNNV